MPAITVATSPTTLFTLPTPEYRDKVLQMLNHFTMKIAVSDQRIAALDADFKHISEKVIGLGNADKISKKEWLEANRETALKNKPSNREVLGCLDTGLAEITNWLGLAESKGFLLIVKCKAEGLMAVLRAAFQNSVE